MSNFEPFANDSHSTSIGDMIVENGTDSIGFYGQIDLSRDKAGLARARALRAFFDSVVAALEGEAALPDALPDRKPGTIKNPFV